MIINYLKLGLRIIIKHPFFSLINIISLALSMSACLIIITIIRQQFNYEKEQKHKDNIYRINTTVQYSNGAQDLFASSAVKLSSELRKEANIVEKAITIRPTNTIKLTNNLNSYSLKGAYTNTEIFSVFSLGMKQGNPEESLTKPNSIILSYKTWEKLFANQEAIGRILTIQSLGKFTVTGILSPQTGNTHLTYDFYLSESSIPYLEKQAKIDSSANNLNNYYTAYTYIKATEKTTKSVVDNTLAALSNQLATKIHFSPGEKSYTFNAQKLTDITPHHNYILENSEGMSYKSIFILGLSILILITLTCFNYSSLTIARALTRTKEIGIRKVFGATRFQIITQFIVESIIISTVSLFIGTTLLPFIPMNEKLQNAVVNSKMDVELAAYFVIFSIVVGILAGLIPGLVLSKFEPIQILKKLTNIKIIGGLKFRKVLICFQFSISFILIINLVILYKQVTYMADSDYGYDSKNTITIRINEKNNYQILKNEFSQLPQVTGVSGISTNFGYQPSDSYQSRINKSDAPIELSTYFVDERTIPDFKLNIINGENFSSDSSRNEGKIIINEKAVTAFGFSTINNAIGKQVWVNDSTKAVIIAVLKDFNFESYKVPITPMALSFQLSQIQLLNLKIKPTEISGFRQEIERIKNRLQMKQPIEWYNLEEEFRKQQLHSDDTSMIAFLTLLFLAIACLGLLGATSYNIEQRVKELNIRKILGASVWDLFYLMSKEYIILLVIATFLGTPLGYISGKLFLSSFTYQAEIGILPLIGGWFSVLAIGLIIISSQTLKSAMSTQISKVE